MVIAKVIQILVTRWIVFTQMHSNPVSSDCTKFTYRISIIT